jgi:acid stress-induced BolA-like protein IbaG/YrbA
MEPQEIKRMIEAGLPGCTAEVSGDGSHFDATVISGEFSGKSTVKKHQLVFATLGDNIASGAIHALNINAYTPEEWESR